jgi:serine/threonine protein kinase
MSSHEPPQDRDLKGDETVVSRTAPVCNNCSSKLAGKHAASSTNRTTIMRPVLHVGGTAILSDSDRSQAPDEDVRIAPIPSSAASSDDKHKLPSSRIDSGIRKAVEDENTEEPITRRRVNNYEIIAEISRGSFGVVYKARQPGLEREVALKVLLAGVHASAEAVARFHREARAVARLKHPNIVPIYDIGTHDGHHYFAMEFVDGFPLSTLISEHRITSPQALAVAESLADAFHSAHRAGVIHRDIKPSNILIDGQGQPHITDFGLAKQVDLDTKYTMSGTTLGTPAYMPPEQARGEIDKVDARSDVYAIGAVLYEMLTGRTPFAGRSLLEVVVAVISEPVKPPRQLNPNIHRDVQTIVLKCLEKDPRRRYQTSGELRDDLRRFRSGEAIKAKPAGTVRLAARFVRRQSALLGAIAVVLFALGLSYVRVAQQTSKTDELVKTIAKLTKENEVQWLPYWWFPLKDADALNNIPKEQRPRYETAQKQPQDFKGLVPLPATATEIVLVSPKEYDFSDADTDIYFKVPDAGAEDGLKIGVQTTDKKQGFEHIPFLLEFDPGMLRLSGPLNLFQFTTDRANTQPHYGPKAEKIRPALQKGDYKLTLHREELLLRFDLSGPTSFSISIKDPSLTNWVFTTTQLIVRAPKTSTIQFTSAEVRRRALPVEAPGLKSFREGMYDAAEKELPDLANSEDLLKQAQATFRLGVIREIWEPQPGKDLELYKTALEALNALNFENQRKRKELSANLLKTGEQKAAIEKELKALDQSDRERVALAIELRVRRIVRLALSKSNWNFVESDLQELRSLIPARKIGEPLAWEFQPVLEYLLSSDRTRDEKIRIARSIFNRLGIEPGSKSLGKSAAKLALLIAMQYEDEAAAKDHIAGDLIELQRAFPSEELMGSFKVAIEDAVNAGRIHDAGILLKHIGPSAHTDEQLKLLSVAGAHALMSARTVEEAEQALVWRSPQLVATLCDQMRERQSSLVTGDFGVLTTVLLPALANAGLDAEDTRRLGETLEKLAEEMIKNHRLNDLVRLHDAMRGTNAIDGRLAKAFAEGIFDAAQGVKTHVIAEDLLKYAAVHVSSTSQPLQQAAATLAQKKVEADPNHDDTAMLPVYKIYPSPGIADFADAEMAKLLESAHQEEAIKFYIRARSELGRDGSRLTPRVIAALEKIDTDRRDAFMRDIWQQVHDALLLQQKNEAGDRVWILEFGDMRAAFGQLEEARAAYHALHTRQDVEIELYCKATLRLTALLFALNDQQWFNAPRKLMEGNKPEEARLAAGLLLMPHQETLAELPLKLQAAGGPLLFEPCEWEFLRGMRLVLDNRDSDAQTAWQNVINESTKTHSWISGVASILVRGNNSDKPKPKVEQDN